MNAVSVIVPTLNEVDNIEMLVSRIAAGFHTSGLKYEIVFIDDHSTDGTVQAIENLSGEFPVRYLLKQGERGKAYSLLEGFAAARYEILCMIDADLQYPPEAILPMYRLMETTKTDIVLTNRHDHATSRVRKITSSGFNFVFTKMLFGFDYDSQSGLKLFKKSVIESITLTPTPWSFDLEFIVRSLEQDFKIVSYDIPFAERYAGVAKIQVSKVAVELAKASVKLRFTSSPRKVKQAYKTNNQNVKRVLTGSVVALAAGMLFALNSPTPASALSVQDLKSEGSQFVTSIANYIDPVIVQPETNSPTATPTPPAETTPATTTTPVPVTQRGAATSTSQLTTTTPRSPTASKSATQTQTTGSNTAVQPAASNTPSTLAVEPSTTTATIRYPALANQAKAGYDYPERVQGRAVGFIRPLQLTALTIFIGSLAVYAATTTIARFRTMNYQSSASAPGANRG